MGKKQKKITIENEVVSMPIESIPFINTGNSSYLMPKYAYTLTVDGKEEMRYDVEVLCSYLAEYIKHDMKFMFIKDSSMGSVLYYVYRDGYYQLLLEDEFRSLIAEYIPSLIRKTKDINEVFGLLLADKSFYIDNSCLKGNKDYINFKNGILDIRTMELLPHTPDMIFTVQIPVDYKPIDECQYGQVFEKYMNELTSGNEVTKKVLYEVMGLVLSNIPGYFTKKCILMIGEKDCGKTQIKKLLTELIGINYTSSIELSTMNGNRFGTSELYNKRLVGSNDMQYTSVQDMGIFKQLTGGDPVSVEFKGRGAFSYVFNGVIWFLANDYPIFSGKKGKEVYERFMIIPCKHVVEKDKQDPMLVDKMLKEKEYIVSLCINHLKDLIDRKFRFEVSQEINDSLEEYELTNNSILQFVNEYCVVDDELDPLERLNFSKFKKYYQIWCKDLGIPPMKLGRDEIKLYLFRKYGTTIVKSSTYFLSNIGISDTFKEDYMSWEK